MRFPAPTTPTRSEGNPVRTARFQPVHFHVPEDTGLSRELPGNSIVGSLAEHCYVSQSPPFPAKKSKPLAQADTSYSGARTPPPLDAAFGWTENSGVL